jgi:hypothetical protein
VPKFDMVPARIPSGELPKLKIAWETISQSPRLGAMQNPIMIGLLYSYPLIRI